MSPGKVGGLLMERDGANEVIKSRNVCLDHPEYQGNAARWSQWSSAGKVSGVKPDARALPNEQEQTQLFPQACGFFQLPLIWGCFCTEASLHASLVPATSKKEAFQTWGGPPCQTEHSLLVTIWHAVTSHWCSACWECGKGTKELGVSQKHSNTLTPRLTFKYA